MARLQLNLLGELEVLRDGESLPLPPSKKTRALLGYLALTNRPLRREALCELLWEVPDDPRGSLRWSLSKLRRLVDDDAHQRIRADRLHVELDVNDVDVDVVTLHRLAASPLDRTDVAELERVAALYRGSLLEGLELPNFYDFHSWCMAEREHAAKSYGGVLHALTERLAHAPERALPHARARVVAAPYDEAARAELIGMLVALHRNEEAEQQFAVGKRLLKEVGSEPSPALYRALRTRPPASPADATPPTVARADTAMAAPVPERASASDTTLVGREAELERLIGLFADAVGQRRGRVLLIRGDPGVGKSRLLQAVASHASSAGATLLEASAFESEVMRPFSLWIDGLRAIDGYDAVFGEHDYDNRERLFGALNAFVEQRSSERALVLLFDDLQWCDESSAAALQYVARMNRQRPVLGVLAARDDELQDNAAVQQMLRGLLRDEMFEELKLTPLAADALRQLIELRAPGADSARLSEHCAGNPLLAIELARAETVGEVGSSLDELIRQRLSHADEGGEVLMWAAVLNPHLDVPTLCRVTGYDATRIGAALAAAERQAMLQPSERGWRFAHDLITRQVYAEIAPARRRVMHRRIAELFEQDTAKDLGRAADLAHHALQSGDAALAARAIVSAGQLCLRFFANDDALALARQGMALAPQLPDAERVCVTLDLHNILRSAAPLDDWQAAAREYVALAEAALDHGALAHARLGYHMASYVRWLHGHSRAAREESLQAERIARGASEEEHIIGMAEAAKCLAMLERDLPQADAMSMEAQALAQRTRINHHAIPTAMGILRFQENHLDEAEALFKEARTLCKAAGDRVNEFMANEYLMMIEFERGHFAAAQVRCEVLRELGEKLGTGSEAPFARALGALCRYAIDNEDAGLDAALDGLRLADAKHRLAYTLTRAAFVDLDRGHPQQARERASEALACAELLERPTDMLLAHVALADAHRALDEPAAFEGHVAALAAFDDQPVAQWARQRAARLRPVAVEGQ